MNNAPNWLPHWAKPAYAFLDQTGPLANFVTVAVPLSGLIAAVFFFLLRRAQHKDVVIKHLNNELARRDRALQKEIDIRAGLEEKLDKIRSRLPEIVLAQVDRELIDGNDRLAYQAAESWFEENGQPIAQLLAHQAHWAAARAVGEARSAGLHAAESFVQAAATVWIYDENYRRHLAQFHQLRHIEQIEQPSSLKSSLEILQNDDSHFRLSPELIERALEMERESSRLYARNLFHLAMPTIDNAISIIVRQIGKKSTAALRCRKLRVQLLGWLGRNAEALTEIVDIIPLELLAFGPDHPNTLASGFLRARVLDTLGRSAEALTVIDDVAARQAASPELGPDHPNTLASGFLRAQVLDKLGRSAEALTVIDDVAARQAASPELGPDHPNTLTSGFLRARVLDTLGRSAEALTVIDDVAARQAASPELGPDHPNTLISGFLRARVLDTLGRSAEALTVIDDVATRQGRNLSVGETHPETLKSISLRDKLRTRLRSI
jgi:hypothetical protein